MTRTTKILLAISLIGFALGCTDFLWGMGRPVGAVFLGLFLISRVLEKEAAFFDQEERGRLSQAQKALAQSGSRGTRQVELGRAGLGAVAKA